MKRGRVRALSRHAIPHISHMKRHILAYSVHDIHTPVRFRRDGKSP